MIDLDSDGTNDEDAWTMERPSSDVVSSDFVVDLDGYEGPLDLLLTLARTQKVDLSKISILALSEQYLRFIETARRLRLDIAADYLVMAAWLAYLKSRLLLPKDDDSEGLSGEEMADRLAFRLRRLEAMRDVARQFVSRTQLGEDFFARGDPEPVITETSSTYDASVYDLLTAYAAQNLRREAHEFSITRREVCTLHDARQTLVRLLGDMSDWTRLDTFVVSYLSSSTDRPDYLASTFAAGLELVREGQLSMKQSTSFGPVYIRRHHEFFIGEHHESAPHGS